MFGNMKFDVYIDFSGYVDFWSAFMAFSNEATKVIYQHNDMEKEFNKVVNGKRVHEDKLSRVFNLYKEFDKVIAVSEPVKKTNAKNLTKYYSEDKAISIGNFIDYEKILRMSDAKDKEVVKALTEIKNVTDIQEKQRQIEFEEALFAEFNIQFTKETKVIEEPLYIGYFGRISPEKGQFSFISKLPIILKKIPNLIVLIVGSGPEENKLKQLVQKQGLEDNVIFLGMQRNPFPIMKLVDIVMLMSYSEGQPMTLLEAKVLGKKIITSDIEGNISVTQGICGSSVENSSKAIIDAIENGPIGAQFNPQEYNEQLVNKYNELFS